MATYRGGSSRLMRILTKKDSDDEEDELFKKYAAGKGRGSAAKKEKLRKKKAGGAGGLSEDQDKKKPHFVNLLSKEGQDRIAVKLPGRHVCECQARQHALVNNCLKCGRVVCDQEGSGPCFFCGELVCTQQEEDIINRGTKKSLELKRQLMAGVKVKNLEELKNDDRKEIVSEGGPSSLSQISEQFRKAIKEKDRLLSYDKDFARRTHVIDDQADYFRMDINPWMSKEERMAADKLRAEKIAKLNQPRSQRSTKVTLDFLGRQVVEENEEQLTVEEQEEIYRALVERAKAANYTVSGDDGTNSSAALAFSDSIAAPGLNMRILYENGSRVRADGGDGVMSEDVGRVRGMRIQDMARKELSEGGYCLSMHQPYASLLVRGIKKHEGRTWYSGHRGILWIAATARTATRDEVKELENFYHTFYDGSLPAPFPESYPSGCLLGCVDVVDCLAQEEYMQQYPYGESDSAYMLICEDAKEMPVKMPIRGQHKIYKLDQNIHRAARKLINQGSKVGYKLQEDKSPTST